VLSPCASTPFTLHAHFKCAPLPKRSLLRLGCSVLVQEPIFSTYLMSGRNIYGDLCAENGRTFLNSALASILRIGNCLREARRGPGPALDRNDKNAR
jgi:hypothetical protein